ncbi:MAG: extracellular solute-binding protein, partial [Chloroflexia bacterium]|nr:extracellular solute-binding protein [Chloroflexia bacterium]
MSQEHDTPNGILNRRRFLRTMAVGTAALAAGVLAACTASKPATSTEATVAPAADAATGEVAKIKALMWSNSPVLDENFKKRADLFNAKYKGKYEVDMQLLPWDQYWPKVDLAYASKDPIDVYFWDVQAYGHYKQGLLKNVQEEVNVVADLNNPELYPTKLFDVWRFDGANLFAIPENLQMMQMFYNKDLFDKAGVKYPDASWTWNDVLAAAAKLKITEGDTVTQWGFDI